MTHRSQTGHRRGIALIITLSIMVLITVALSKTFQDTALEIKMIKHEENLFIIKQINRSFFRAFLMAIKSFGANKTNKFITTVIPADIPVPISSDEDAEDGYLANPQIISLDHYFKMNTSAYDRDAGAVDRDILINVLSKKNTNNPPPTYAYYSFIGGLADFIDQDEDEISKNFLIGKESYFSEKIGFSVKNNDLDLLSELRVLPQIREMNYTINTLRLLDFPLRLEKVAFEECKIGKYNLNFLSGNEALIKEELYNFSSMFEGIASDGNCHYDVIAAKNNIDAIIELATKKLGGDSSEQLEGFKIPLNQDDLWKETISSLHIPGALSSFISFFSSRSELIKIKYEILYGQFRVKNEAILRLGYGAGDSDIPIEINVLYFKST